MTPQPTCPAANLEHGTLSLNRQDVRCRIVGNLRGTDGAPCVGDYCRCAIWQGEKVREWANKRAAVAAQMQHAGTGDWVAA
jgi:hypothetical protein